MKMTYQSATSQASQIELPEKIIDRLFARFATMYGKHWLEMWNGIPMQEVRKTWIECLGEVSVEQIRHALAHCVATSKFPPTAPEFSGICRQFRTTPFSAHHLLPAPRDPAGSVIASELASTLRKQPDKRDTDCRGWARKILAEAEKGVVYPMIAIDNAREALGIKR